MELWADRFLALPGGSVFDLAQGQHVTVRRWTLDGRAQQMARATRCAALAGLRHPHLIPLVDYGCAGTSGWFEAFARASPRRRWRRRDGWTAFAIESLASFLHGHNLSIGTVTWERVYEYDGRPALGPDDRTGLHVEDESARRATWAEEERAVRAVMSTCAPPHGAAAVAGVVLQPRRATGELVRLLEAAHPVKWHHVHVRATRGAGLTTWVQTVARDARLRGFVPVQLAAFAQWPGLSSLLAGRHLMLLDDPGCHGAVPDAFRVRILTGLGIDGARPGLIVRLRGDQCRLTPALDLDPISARAMIGMTTISRAGGGSTRMSLELAARQSAGRPGAFLQAITREKRYRRDSHPASLARASEAAHPYVVVADPVVLRRLRYEEPADASGDREGTTGVLFGGEGATVLGRAMKGVELAQRGRPARAERLLRWAMSGLLRRGAVGYAAQVSMSLGRLLLARGRADGAAAAFERAHGLFVAMRWPRDAAEATTFVGLARTDVGRLSEAEAALSAAHIAAKECGDEAGALLAQLALARCLLWQGRWRDARNFLDAPRESAGHLRLTAHRLASRLALKGGDLSRAGRHAAAALALARTWRRVVTTAARTLTWRPSREPSGTLRLRGSMFGKGCRWRALGARRYPRCDCGSRCWKRCYEVMGRPRPARSQRAYDARCRRCRRY